MTETPVFLYGAFADPKVLDIVVGADAGLRLRSAILPGYSTFDCPDNGLISIEEMPAGSTEFVEGQLVEGLDAEPRARLAFFAACFGYELCEVPVTLERGARGCAVSFRRRQNFDAKLHENKELSCELKSVTTFAAPEIMSYFAARSASDVAQMMPTILMRADARRRAQNTAPSTLRSDYSAADHVEIDDARVPYVNYFKVGELDLSFRRFDGSMSETVNRAGFEAADAVTVLPYDPVADTVLLVEQFRIGPLLRGDPKPWMLEPIAGRIDPGESPESTARREAIEEAGLTLTHLEKVAAGYPSPGAYTEFLYSYVALTSLDGQGGGTFGLLSEAEDIRTHVVPFARLMGLVQTGEAACGPLVMSAFWLSLNRDRLRALA